MPAAILESALAGRAPRTARPWALLTLVAWIARHLSMDGLHVTHPAWTTWYDQSRYLVSAQALAAGDLSVAHHWYPLGYPALAAPFVWVLAGNPFLPLDAILFVATYAAFRRIAARLAVGAPLATAVFIAVTLIQPGLAGAWVRPWTTTLSAAMIWWLAEWTAAATTDAAPAPTRRWVAIGALAGALPLVRPLDALTAATCLAIVAVTLVLRRQLRWRPAAAVAAGGIAVVAAYGALHLAIYGPHPSEYMTGSAHVGFVLADLGFKAYVLLVDARDWFPDSDTILQRLPWIVPGAAGLMVAAAVGPDRRVAALLLALIVPSSAIMLTFADLMPPGLWRFGNIHYFKWTTPAFGLGLVLLGRAALDRRRRGWAAAVLLLLAGPILFLRVVPSPVAPDAPARMLFFHGRIDRDWADGYFALATIQDAAGTLHSPGEFHQVSDTGGARAIAIVRPFAADARRRDPGDLAADPHPYARFEEHVVWGWSPPPPKR